MTSNRIAGSFHWQLKLNKMGFGGRTFSPSQRFALTDTGTSLIIMPDEDWQNLYEIICDQVSSRYGIECIQEASFMLLKAPGITTMIFDPITIQFDNIVYEVPWNRWFDRMFDDTLYM